MSSSSSLVLSSSAGIGFGSSVPVGSSSSGFVFLLLVLSGFFLLCIFGFQFLFDPVWPDPFSLSCRPVLSWPHLVLSLFVFVINSGFKRAIPVQNFGNRGQCISLLVHRLSGRVQASLCFIVLSLFSKIRIRQSKNQSGSVSTRYLVLMLSLFSGICVQTIRTRLASGFLCHGPAFDRAGLIWYISTPAPFPALLCLDLPALYKTGRA